MGRGPEPDFTNYHRLLNRDTWSCRQAGRILLGLILAILAASMPLVLAGDETVEHRHGRKIRVKTCFATKAHQQQSVRRP